MVDGVGAPVAPGLGVVAGFGLPPLQATLVKINVPARKISDPFGRANLNIFFPKF